jgi:hypothetical protein
MKRLMKRLSIMGLLLVSVAAAWPAARAAEPVKMRLWPDGAPGAKGDTDADQPFVQIWQADPTTAKGSAFVVCPGGGYGGLAAWPDRLRDWLGHHGFLD